MLVLQPGTIEEPLAAAASDDSLRVPVAVLSRTDYD
jgi:hypothetical protein